MVLVASRGLVVSHRRDAATNRDMTAIVIAAIAAANPLRGARFDLQAVMSAPRFSDLLRRPAIGE
jgi:hypothetical protein